MKLEGKITIGRTRGGDERRPVHIDIVDESSGIQALQVSMSLSELATALMGQGHVSCKCEWRGLDRVGMIAEHKTVAVVLKRSPSESEIDAAFYPIEVDGWVGDRCDATNHHRWTKVDGKDATNVIFRRHVPAKRKGKKA